MGNMGNKLKELFSDQEMYDAKIEFDDATKYEEFCQALKRVSSEGTVEQIDGVKAVTTKAIDGNNSYLENNESLVSNMVIGLCPRKISIPVEIDGEKIAYYMNAFDIDNGIKLRSLESEIIEFKADYDKNKGKINFTYLTHMDMAKSILELINAYSKFCALLKVLFKGDIKPAESIIESLTISIRHFKMLLELEKTIGITIKPQNIAKETNANWMIEKIYFLLVKHEKIRDNEKLNSIDAVETGDETVGTELLASFIKTMDCEIFEETFTMYTVNCIFNAVISEIQVKDDGTKKIMFSDTESKPMYRVFSGFINEKDALIEQGALLENVNSYKNAHQFNELLNNHVKDFTI